MTVEAAIDDSTLRAASAALVTAFEDDPLLGRVFPGNRDRVALLRSAVRTTVRLAQRRGRIDVYRQPDGEVAGAAVWLPGDASGSVSALGLAVRLGAEVLVRRPSAVPDLARHRLRLRTIHRRLGRRRTTALLRSARPYPVAVWSGRLSCPSADRSGPHQPYRPKSGCPLRQSTGSGLHRGGKCCS